LGQCGGSLALPSVGAVSPPTDEEMMVEAAAGAAPIIVAAPGWDSRDIPADQRSLLGVPAGWKSLDLQHAEALIAGALETPAPDPATTGADDATETPIPQ